MSNLPVKEVRHEEEHPVCEKSGAEMKEIGEEKAYDELVYVLGEFYVFFPSLTVAILESDVLQVTVCPAGAGVAVIVSIPPT